MGVSELFQFHYWSTLYRLNYFLMRDHGVQINLDNQILYFLLLESLKLYHIALISIQYTAVCKYVLFDALITKCYSHICLEY